MTILIFTPKLEELLCLKSLTGAPRICEFSEGLGRSVLLLCDKSTAIGLRVAYRYVVPKFECFGIFVQGAIDATVSPIHTHEIARLTECADVRCLFRFEWKRPARVGEVPPNWEQTIVERGRRSGISSDASAVCVSMVGILFSNPSEMVLIKLDDENPATLLVQSKIDRADSFLEECEGVFLADAIEWLQNCRDSLEAIERDWKQRP